MGISGFKNASSLEKSLKFALRFQKNLTKVLYRTKILPNEHKIQTTVFLKKTNERGGQL